VLVGEGDGSTVGICVGVADGDSVGACDGQGDGCVGSKVGDGVRISAFTVSFKKWC
jgi:hypothetical protein